MCFLPIIIADIELNMEIKNDDLATPHFTGSVQYFLLLHRLPSKLVIDWPEGNELKTNCDVPAGSTIGIWFFAF